ncbi:hypothetical protein INR49_025449 [Caranx melampygus]|nr:hypothetical protein INR49_025449 [Caranx melampygus]
MSGLMEGPHQLHREEEEEEEEEQRLCMQSCTRRDMTRQRYTGKTPPQQSEGFTGEEEEHVEEKWQSNRCQKSRVRATPTELRGELQQPAECTVESPGGQQCLRGSSVTTHPVSLLRTH